MDQNIADNEMVYDEMIAPLMSQIIEICKEYGVPMLAAFQLTDDESDPSGKATVCTTAILEGAHHALWEARASLGNIEPIGVGGTPLIR